MTHIFYEFSSLKPGVPDVETLMEVINSSELTRFVMGAEVVDFVKKALIVNTTIGSFKNCYFAFDDGAYFLEFDGKGKSRRFTEVPDWFVSPAEFARSQWLINHDLADVKATAFIDVLMSYPLKSAGRTAICCLVWICIRSMWFRRLQPLPEKWAIKTEKPPSLASQISALLSFLPRSLRV